MKFNKYLLLPPRGCSLVPFLRVRTLDAQTMGPEPIIVQIKESLRLSDDLDNRLSQLEAAHKNGLNVRKVVRGRQASRDAFFSVELHRTTGFDGDRRLQQLPAVEKVVAVSAANLEFKAADFVREYASNQAMPEAARRGLDRG